MLVQKVCRLKAVRQNRIDGLLNDTRSGESDQSMALSDHDVAEHTNDAVTSPIVGCVKTVIYKPPERSNVSTPLVLAIWTSENILLHPAHGSVVKNKRQFLPRRVLNRTRHVLSDGAMLPIRKEGSITPSTAR